MCRDHGPYCFTSCAVFMIKHNQLGCLCLCFCVQDRRVEITGPTDRKMVINALNRCWRVLLVLCCFFSGFVVWNHKMNALNRCGPGLLSAGGRRFDGDW